MNTSKKIIFSLLIIILIAPAPISTLSLTPPAGEAPDNTPPSKGPGWATGEVKMAHDAGSAFDHRCDKDGEKDVKEVVNGTPASLIELVDLVEFYSRKYFKLALDYLFELLNSLGIFPPEDLASSLNHVDPPLLAGGTKSADPFELSGSGKQNFEHRLEGNEIMRPGAVIRVSISNN
jgi:hypothetical protein